MTNKITGVALVAILVIAIGGYVFPTQSVKESVDGVFGAFAGPDVQNRVFFGSGATSGGRLATTSTATTYIMASNDLNLSPTYIDWTPNVNTTISLTSTSTFPYVPKVGDTATVYIRNASSTAGSSITFAALNGNVDLQYTEATGGDLVLNGLDFASLTFIRESENLVTILFNEFTEAD